MKRVWVVGVVAFIGVLTACTSPQPIQEPSGSASAVSKFASDADALTQASAALNRYLRAVDDLQHSGVGDVSSLREFVTTSQLAREATSAAALEQTGDHTAGWSEARNTQLQQRRIVDSLTEEVTLYSCIDSSHVVLLNSKNQDVTNPKARRHQTVEIRFLSSNATLLVDGVKPWSQDLC